MLIPFTYYSNDSLSVSTGNPYLKPEKFLNIELNYSYKKRYNFISASVSYNKNSDLHGINTYIDNNNIMHEKYDNISYSDIYRAYIYTNLVIFRGKLDYQFWDFY